MTVTAPTYRRPMVAAAGGGRWRPWKDLAGRPDIDFALVDLPPGAPRAIHASIGDVHVVLIDRALPPAERLAALAHELVHHERGGSGHCEDMPGLLRPVVAREERRVDQIAACRLVPFDELAAVVAKCCDVLGGVTAVDIAEEFGVSEHLAEIAIEQWLRGAA